MFLQIINKFIPTFRGLLFFFQQLIFSHNFFQKRDSENGATGKESNLFFPSYFVDVLHTLRLQFGWHGRNRTSNHPINSRTLCQLSYMPTISNRGSNITINITKVNRAINLILSLRVPSIGAVHVALNFLFIIFLYLS
jgi:hypothetical protein